MFTRDKNLRFTLATVHTSGTTQTTDSVTTCISTRTHAHTHTKATFTLASSIGLFITQGSCTWHLLLVISGQDRGDSAPPQESDCPCSAAVAD